MSTPYLPSWNPLVLWASYMSVLAAWRADNSRRKVDIPIYASPDDLHRELTRQYEHTKLRLMWEILLLSGYTAYKEFRQWQQREDRPMRTTPTPPPNLAFDLALGDTEGADPEHDEEEGPFELTLEDGTEPSSDFTLTLDEGNVTPADEVIEGAGAKHAASFVLVRSILKDALITRVRSLLLRINRQKLEILYDGKARGDTLPRRIFPELSGILWLFSAAAGEGLLATFHPHHTADGFGWNVTFHDKAQATLQQELDQLAKKVKAALDALGQN